MARSPGHATASTAGLFVISRNRWADGCRKTGDLIGSAGARSGDRATTMRHGSRSLGAPISIGLGLGSIRADYPSPKNSVRSRSLDGIPACSRSKRTDTHELPDQVLRRESGSVEQMKRFDWTCCARGCAVAIPCFSPEFSLMTAEA